MNRFNFSLPTSRFQIDYNCWSWAATKSWKLDRNEEKITHIESKLSSSVCAYMQNITLFSDSINGTRQFSSSQNKRAENLTIIQNSSNSLTFSSNVFHLWQRSHVEYLPLSKWFAFALSVHSWAFRVQVYAMMVNVAVVIYHQPKLSTWVMVEVLDWVFCWEEVGMESVEFWIIITIYNSTQHIELGENSLLFSE